MRNIVSKRQEKERGMSVEKIISDLSNRNDLNDILVIGINDNGDIETGYSLDDRMRVIGLLETLKTTLIDEINYPDI